MRELAKYGFFFNKADYSQALAPAADNSHQGCCLSSPSRTWFDFIPLQILSSFLTSSYSTPKPQGDTHDDILLLVTSLLRVVVKVVITMDRSEKVVV